MTKKSVFLDTNFLVATQVETHQFFERTLALRTQFLEEGYQLFTSILTIDEFWYVLIGLWRASTTRSDMTLLFTQLKKATANILSFENICVLGTSLNKTETLNTVDIMHKYKMRPRDSLIISLMKRSGIKSIASFDTDFDKVVGVKRIS